jgi:hypothetical protein
MENDTHIVRHLMYVVPIVQALFEERCFIIHRTLARDQQEVFLVGCCCPKCLDEVSIPHRFTTSTALFWLISLTHIPFLRTRLPTNDPNLKKRKTEEAATAVVPEGEEVAPPPKKVQKKGASTAAPASIPIAAAAAPAADPADAAAAATKKK